VREAGDPGRFRRLSRGRAAGVGLRTLLPILVILILGSSVASASASASGLVSFGQFDGSDVTGETLNAPWGVTVDSATGNVYVADITGHVKKFTAAGAFLADVVGTAAQGTGFGSATSVVVNPDNGDVYVSDETHSQLLRYSSTGALVAHVATGNGPSSLARNPASGDVYVAEESSGAVERFSASLDLLATNTSLGGHARGVAVDPSTGNVWVSTGTAGQVVTLDANLGFLSSFDASPGAGPDTTGLGIDPVTGHVYAVDSNYAILQVFDYTGSLLSVLGGSGPAGAGGVKFSLPIGVGVDPTTGVVYVADAGCGQSEDPNCVGAGRVEILGAPPTISGSPLDGSTLYASRPSQVGRGPFTYSYQWLECPSGDGVCTSHGAPSSTNGLRLAPADEGKVFEVAVTATSSLGTIGPILSGRVGPVAASPPVNTVIPVISGTPADGTVLNATHGTWSGAPVTSYTYQWQSCNAGSCVPVSNASGYRLAPTDVGHTIQIQVSATNPDGTAGPVVSTAVGPVTASPPVDTVLPSITGTLAAGNRVQGRAGTWTGVLPITYTYQWQRCPDGTAATCVDIPGATINNYRLTAADTHVRLVVIATNADGQATAAAPVAP
jgi:DNA-binding beta-propeller fold protein YncE